MRAALARSAGLAGLATLTSRLLGLARETALAAIFGAGNEMDAFNVAFRIPNLVRDLFAEGAMSAAFVPTFTRHLTLSGKEEAWRLGNNVINALMVVTGAVVALALLFVRPLVTAYAGDFATVPGKLELTIHLTSIMLPLLLLVAIAVALMGMLNSLHHYFVPALSPAMFNIATIVCAFALVPVMQRFGQPGISAIAIAAILGGIGQIVLQWPPLVREGFHYHPRLDVRDPGLRQILALMGPGTLGLAATQVNLLVNTQLAAGQGTGAVSWLAYSFRLMYVPIGLFGVSIATAVLPAAARHAARDETSDVRRTLSHGLSLMLTLNIPATFGLIVLAAPIIRLLLERGHFLPSDTAATAAALQFYAIGLVGYSTTRIASPVFYALGQSRVPVMASLISIAVNVIASVLLVRAIGFRGLALGTSVAALVNGTLLMTMLRTRLGGVDGRTLLMTFSKMIVASLVMAGVALGSERWLTVLVAGSSLTLQAFRLTTTIVAALVALAVAAKLLRVTELDEVAALVGHQVRKLLD